MNISTGYNTPIVAVALDSSPYGKMEGRLSIYDLNQRLKLLVFPVRFDAGGERVALSPNNHDCFVGCYQRYGLASYSVDDGSENWRHFFHFGRRQGNVLQKAPLKTGAQTFALAGASIIIAGAAGLNILSATTGKQVYEVRSQRIR